MGTKSVFILFLYTCCDHRSLSSFQISPIGIPNLYSVSTQTNCSSAPVVIAISASPFSCVHLLWLSLSLFHNSLKNSSLYSSESTSDYSFISGIKRVLISGDLCFYGIIFNYSLTLKNTLYALKYQYIMVNELSGVQIGLKSYA